jgi:hypothetical protein
MQKWQIRTTLCSTIRQPIRSSAQYTFSTSQSLRDDERPRSNRQASAKAGRLIANLAADNTRGRSKDPNFGLRGLKPQGQNQTNTEANRASKPTSGSFTIRKVTAADRDTPSPRRSSASDRNHPALQQQQDTSPSGQLVVRKFVAPDSRASRSSRGPYEAKTRGENQYKRKDMVQRDVQKSYNNREVVGGKEAGQEVGDDLQVVQDVGEDFEVLNPEDEDYVEQLEQSVYQTLELAEKETGGGIRPYNPEPMKAEELHSSFIGIAAGELGIASAAKQAMGRLGHRNDIDYQYDAELASRLYRGEVVRFRDAEEKKRVVEMAEEFASNTANRIMVKKGEWEPKIDVGFVPVPDEVKEQLTGKAMRGLYPPVPSVEVKNIQEKTMAHLRRSVLLNETYSPSQGKAMVDFITKMWPAERSTPTSASGKQKRA